jgi:O-antigen ligase
VVDTAIAPSTVRAAPEPRADARPAVEGRPHRWLIWLCGAYIASVFLSRWNYPAIAVALVSVAIIVVRLVRLRRIDRIGWMALVYLACLTVYGIFVGAAPVPREIPAFLSFEGRIYISFLPLLVIATTKVNRADMLMVRGLMRACVVAGAGLLALWMIGVRGVLGNGGNFAGLTSSHHASGFLFAVAALVLLVPSFYERRRIDVVLGTVALGIVVASGSRTTLVGLLLAGIYLVVSSPSTRNRARMISVIAVGLVATAILSGRALSTVQYLGSSAFLQDAAAQFSQPESPETGKSVTIGAAPGASLANILIRFGVWRASLDEIAKSPILGIGPWRLNDIDRHETGIPGIVVLATSGEQVNGSGFGSHNLVLQTAAETGLLGLFLLAAPWVLIAQRVRRRGSLLARPTLALIWLCIGTLFTSNAMISPALCFPVLVYVMVAARLEPADDDALATAEGQRV